MFYHVFILLLILYSAIDVRSTYNRYRRQISNGGITNTGIRQGPGSPFPGLNNKNVGEQQRPSDYSANSKSSNQWQYFEMSDPPQTFNPAYNAQQQINENNSPQTSDSLQQQKPIIHGQLQASNDRNFQYQQRMNQQNSYQTFLNNNAQKLQYGNNNNKAPSPEFYQPGNIHMSEFVPNDWLDNENKEWFPSNGFYAGDLPSLTSNIENFRTSTDQLFTSKLAKYFRSRGKKSYSKYEIANGRETVCTHLYDFDGSSYKFGYFPCPLPDTDPSTMFCCGQKNRQYCCNIQERNIEQWFRRYGYTGEWLKKSERKQTQSKTVILAIVLPVLAVLLLLALGLLIFS
ncbi:unnamed protein product [Didymodactylos carnosus]|uniref:Shisa N-terminal domain-containing protein n=1 Tax=Didymodactylos carnosus TaxID=1234261 RepID=A0A815N4G0_9BILA|nr:unnamed protein product [Didymodactylos carnosus]CAF4308030.1 unnamed protein product [Didymodactylos carnosus]